MIPDRNICRRVKSYDKNLFIKWNVERAYFELWMKRSMGGVILITPITRSIYDERAAKTYVGLDERLLAWICNADSTRTDKFHFLKMTRAWEDLEFKKQFNSKEDFKHMAKDMWNANQVFVTKYSPSKVKPFNSVKKVQSKFIRPDYHSNFHPRVFGRTRLNAKAYGYKG